MSSKLGKSLKITVFGASHDDEIGVEVIGLPQGESIDLEKLQIFMDRRRPGRIGTTTSRNEPDIPVFTSGLKDGVTTGETLRAVIKNTNVHSSDYDDLKGKPRPGHADFTAYEKYGPDFSMSGGGPFSGRLTAPLCIIGGICMQILERRGIYVGAHLSSVGKEKDEVFPLFPSKELFEEISKKSIPVICNESAYRYKNAIDDIRLQGDSLGGTVECAIIGMPTGVGEPMFDGIENIISRGIFAIPAVKGIEFGAGFNASSMKGSENNDEFILSEDRVITRTNNHGGALGGISTGMPIIFRVAFKPTPSIEKEQHTVDLKTMTETTIKIQGRHDPCVAIRAVPAVEAVAAVSITDMLLSESRI